MSLGSLRGEPYVPRTPFLVPVPSAIGTPGLPTGLLPPLGVDGEHRRSEHLVNIANPMPRTRQRAPEPGAGRGSWELNVPASLETPALAHPVNAIKSPPHDPRAFQMRTPPAPAWAPRNTPRNRMRGAVRSDINQHGGKERNPQLGYDTLSGCVCLFRCFVLILLLNGETAANIGARGGEGV